MKFMLLRLLDRSNLKDIFVKSFRRRAWENKRGKMY